MPYILKMDFYFRSTLNLRHSGRPLLAGILRDGCEIHCEMSFDCHRDEDHEVALNGMSLEKFEFHPETHHESVRARFLMNDLLVEEIRKEAEETARGLWEGRFLHEALEAVTAFTYDEEITPWEEEDVQGE